MNKKLIFPLSMFVFSLLIVGCGSSTSLTTPSQEPTSDPSATTSVEPTNETTTNPSVEPTLVTTDSSNEEPTTSITHDTTAPTFDPTLDPETFPILSEDNKTVTYGMYPQTVETNEEILEQLDQVFVNQDAIYQLNDKYYVKTTSNVFKGESYTFNNGNSIINNNEYWFRCEPIVWNVISNNDNVYYLLSSLLLDTAFYQNNYDERTINDTKIYSNNYEYSYIRNWLNSEFYSLAFMLNDTCIIEETIDNSAKSTDDLNNKYCSNDTKDKVYLPSYDDYLNSNYNFDSTNNLSNTRTCKTTDYSRVKGAWYSKDNGYEFNGTYWTRSPSSKYSYTAKTVNSGGFISDYAVDGTSHCVRPAISVYIPEN